VSAAAGHRWQRWRCGGTHGPARAAGAAGPAVRQALAPAL